MWCYVWCCGPVLSSRGLLLVNCQTGPLFSPLAALSPLTKSSRRPDWWSCLDGSHVSDTTTHATHHRHPLLRRRTRPSPEKNSSRSSSRNEPCRVCLTLKRFFVSASGVGGHHYHHRHRPGRSAAGSAPPRSPFRVSESIRDTSTSYVAPVFLSTTGRSRTNLQPLRVGPVSSETGQCGPATPSLSSPIIRANPSARVTGGG